MVKIEAAVGMDYHGDHQDVLSYGRVSQVLLFDDEHSVGFGGWKRIHCFVLDVQCGLGLCVVLVKYGLLLVGMRSV